MDLKHEFTVPVDRATAWDTFQDVASVADCFPGAVVTSTEGDTFDGTCKVKLGPIALQYSGTGTFLERDEAAGRMVLDAKGRDKRGNGTAGAKVTATFTEVTPDSTKVEVVTDLNITGKPAQFGRGVMQDVSDKLLGQFVTCLQDKVGATDEPETAPEPEAATVGVAGQSGGEATAAAPSGVKAETAPPKPRAVPPPAEDDALDLGATVVPILVKAYWQQLVGVVVAFLVLRWLWGRRG